MVVCIVERFEWCKELYIGIWLEDVIAIGKDADWELFFSWSNVIFSGIVAVLLLDKFGIGWGMEERSCKLGLVLAHDFIGDEYHIEVLFILFESWLGGNWEKCLRVS